MKNSLHLLPGLVLSLMLSLAFAACQDNDLNDGGKPSDADNQTLTETEAQKREALQTLLGALASVDSLPDNWNSPTYAVSPTIGLVKDAAEPHVRYVVTTSQAEANRLYRSYLSKDVSETPTDDSWQMKGIGQMQFKLENDPNLFASLKLDVQQLPQLEEIRFVSEESLGNNGYPAPKGTYYSFGDVVYQEVTSTNEKGQTVVTPTLWVCVRPCSTKPNRRKSHWCSLQLVPAGDKQQQNYLSVGNDTYLPTLLATNKSDAECQVQNFLNVLRIMANPLVALSKSYTGIDDLQKKDNTNVQYDKLRLTSFLWDYFDLWNPNLKLTLDDTKKQINCGVVNKNYNQPNTLRDVLARASTSINAFYNGYSKNYFAKGDYTVYNLHLSTTSQDYSPFLNVQKQTAYVKKSDQFDFTKFETGSPTATPTYFSNSADRTAYQLVVKYRTGGELDGLAHSENDIDPSQSFAVRNAENHITDVLVTSGKKNYATQKTNEEIWDANNQLTGYTQPFFTFGDEVTYTAQGNDGAPTFSGYQFCIRNASQLYTIQNWDEAACFLGYSNGEYNKLEAIDPTRDDVAAALYELLNAYLLNDQNAKSLFNTKEDEAKPANYYQALQRLYAKLIRQQKYVNAGYAQSDKEDLHHAAVQIKVKGIYYVLQLVCKGESNKTYYLYKRTNSQFQNVEPTELSFYNYQDQFTYTESYSLTRSLYVKSKEERDALRLTEPIDLSEFTKNYTFLDKTKN